MDKYELAILGGGPAGASAGVYASRKRLKTLLLTKEFGGQSIVSPDIQNWIGTISISGNELAKSLKEHTKAYADDVLDIKEGQNYAVVNIKKSDEEFVITTQNQEKYTAKSVLVVTGANRRKLNVEGAEKFENKGLTYCATCDGPLFAGQDVVVIGGGNAGFETASQLLTYAKSVTLLQRDDTYKGDKITVEKVLARPNMTGIVNADTKEIKGDKFVEGLVYTNTKTGEEKELKATGVFVEIGLIPTTKFIENLVELDEYKRIKIDPWNQRTAVKGIWAAGDCSNGLYHQNNIAAGDAIKALEDIYIYLRTGK